MTELADELADALRNMLPAPAYNRSEPLYIDRARAALARHDEHSRAVAHGPSVRCWRCYLPSGVSPAVLRVNSARSVLCAKCANRPIGDPGP